MVEDLEKRMALSPDDESLTTNYPIPPLKEQPMEKRVVDLTIPRPQPDEGLSQTKATDGVTSVNPVDNRTKIPTNPPKRLTSILEFEKVLSNKVRFEEVKERFVGNLYLPEEVWLDLGSPAYLKLTIEPGSKEL